MVPVLPLPDVPFRNWGLGGSGVVSEKSDLAGSDSRGLSSLNSQAACPEASPDKDLCLSQEEPSLSPALSLPTVWARQERQTKPARPSLNLSWERSLSVFLSGRLSVF